MSEEKIKQWLKQIMETSVGVEGELRNCSIAVTALRETLHELLPQFDATFERGLQGERCRNLGEVFDEKIAALNRMAQQLLES